ncbi:MAG TPA: phospholipase D-like domain-containing protein [Burkholderiales bacterium]|nr:phospholipase D-like domain-containing protein [Burkholderiales bacterium]
MDASWTISAIALGCLLLLIIVMGLVIWSIRRHRDPHLTIECDAGIDTLLPTLAGITLGSVIDGNSVEVLENGHFWDVLIERVGKARKTVHYETFLWKEGKLGKRMAKALAERAKDGVKVRIMLDAVGSKGIGNGELEMMEKAGARVEFFHEKKLRNIGVLNDRTHRKMLVIDGREAFVGGHCVVDEWLGDAEDGKHFGDVSVRLRGPIVHSVQGAFSENWAGETGELFAGPDCFPPIERAGDLQMHLVYAKPEHSAPAVKILHHTLICLARQRIWIQNPYFIPEPEAIDAFGEAVQRGVDVRVLMPSTSGSDNPMVQHAGHRNFDKLMRNGVRLFEYPHTLLHQKVMTVDGLYSAVGSANFDDRSFETNEEVTLGILDEKTAKKLDAIFEKYLPRAKEIDLEEWNRRSVWHKLKDHAAYSINELL